MIADTRGRSGEASGLIREQFDSDGDRYRWESEFPGGKGHGTGKLSDRNGFRFSIIELEKCQG